MVEKIAAVARTSPIDDLIAKPELIEKVKLEGFKTESVGMYTLGDIREELRKPGRDPRDKFVAPQWRDDVKEIADLKPGMTLEGVVTNVTRFGAFVDVGVHQDGLVHVSELSNRFVKDASEVVKVGPDREGAGAERRPEGQAHRAVDEGVWPTAAGAEGQAWSAADRRRSSMEDQLSALSNKFKVR